ncbi:MAG: hypothetical protein F6K09_37400, partial [Merismopedia sp. SIO2A8]|nr:hypothetical protein [Merismopedia sp. SIO2A8]
NTFRSWPYYQGTGDATKVNKQQEDPTGGADVLVDFVDNQARDTVSCPTGYNLSADNNDDVITGFYACVSADDSTNNNRDVILSLRGNAQGRPAISGESYLPMLETHVLSRPVLDKSTVTE